MSRVKWVWTWLIWAWCCFSGLAHASDYGVLLGVKNVNGQLLVRSFDPASAWPMRERGKLPQPADQRVSGIFQSQNGSIAVLRSSTAPGVTARTTVWLIGIPGSITDAMRWQIAGLPSTDAISSLIVPLQGSPIALVAHYTDTPPFSLFIVNLQSWKATPLSAFRLEPAVRYGHLTQCPVGAIYATAVEIEGTVRLVRFDLERKSVAEAGQLNFNGVPLQSDVADLACAPPSRLYALADPTYSERNSLFTLNPNSGAMTRVDIFDVDHMTFVQ